ncbi:diguanylate cyclase [Massilia sp. B-10]|nr:diguanylate cyclase [Massilia sp. B-10]
MGKLAEGKRSFELGLAWYERGNDKPQVQEVLMEYGSALERAGDMVKRRQGLPPRARHLERAVRRPAPESHARTAGKIRVRKAPESDRSAQARHRQPQPGTARVLAAGDRVRHGRRHCRHPVPARCATRTINSRSRTWNWKQQSSRDPLTGLYNRRHFQEFMRTHVQVEKRGAGTSGEEIVGALFLLDIDHFKHVNDTYGHSMATPCCA